MHLSLVLALCPLWVAGQRLGHFNIWRFPGCSGDPAPDEVKDITIPEEGRCTRARLFLPGWETDPVSGDLQVFVNGQGIGPGCFVGVARGVNPDPAACGEVERFLEPGVCTQFSLPADYGILRCCEGEPCSLPGGFPGLLANDTEVQKKTRDVTLVKRSAPFIPKPAKRQDECRFESGRQFNSRGPQQQIAFEQSCPGNTGADCMIDFTVSFTTGSSETFGAGAEFSAGLFDIVQTSVSFSYDYTYMESQTIQETRSFPIPAGTAGFPTFTQELECVEGTWRGNCDWRVDEVGRACVPSQGSPGGSFGFVRTR